MGLLIVLTSIAWVTAFPNLLSSAWRWAGMVLLAGTLGLSTQSGDLAAVIGTTLIWFGWLQFKWRWEAIEDQHFRESGNLRPFTVNGEDEFPFTPVHVWIYRRQMFRDGDSRRQLETSSWSPARVKAVFGFGRPRE